MLGFRAVLIAVVALAAGSGVATYPHLPEAPKCPIFPATNVWNKRVDKLPVAANSNAIIASIGLDMPLHADFGDVPADSSMGIPYNIAGKKTKRYYLHFYYGGDRGPYPIPAGAKIEPGADHHLLVVDRDSCRLYEIYDLERTGSGWEAGAGAIWNLRSNKLRPWGWTSADAAGLPILPGLIRYDEVAKGQIDHALRFTVENTRNSFIYPARHYSGGSPDPNLPPMGLRVRLKAGVDISHYPRAARVILTALKRYGMFVADNGMSWYLNGTSDPRWSNEVLGTLQSIKGSDFEVVNTSHLRNG